MARVRTPQRPPLPRFAVAWFPTFDGEFTAVMREVSLLAVGRDGKIEPLHSFALNSA